MRAFGVPISITFGGVPSVSSLLPVKPNELLIDATRYWRR